MTRVERVKAIMNSAKRWRRVKRRLRRWAQDKPERRKERLARWTTIRNVCKRRAEYHYKKKHPIRARRWRRRRRWAYEWMQKNQPPPPPPPPPPSGGTSAGSPHWGGCRTITDEVVRIVGGRAPVTSRKRTTTFGNPGSDHYTGNSTADAVDFGIGNAYTLRNEIMRKLGVTSTISDYGSYYVYRHGLRFRVQPIASTHGTGPHLHIGVRRA